MISNIINRLLNVEKEINKDHLPSRGIFYDHDMKISIRKAKMEDIIDYEYGFDMNSVANVIGKIKKIVRNCTIFSEGYSFNDMKSSDIVFVFLEIVKFTNNKPIEIEYMNLFGEKSKIDFNSKTFNYIELGDDIMDQYDTENKVFLMDGFKFSLPSIGVENSLTRFLLSVSDKKGIIKYESLSYDFIYFVGHKNHLSDDEIENLLEIFNYDISEEDKLKIRHIISKFQKMSDYSLKKDNQIIEITQKINLEKIWN